CPCPQSRLRKAVGPETAKQLWDLSVEAVALAKDRIARHGIQCDLKSGQMDVALKERQRVELEERKREMEHDYGYGSLEFVDREAVRSIVGSERYIAGLLDTGSGHLHTLNYTLGLA